MCIFADIPSAVRIIHPSIPRNIASGFLAWTSGRRCLNKVLLPQKLGSSQRGVKAEGELCNWLTPFSSRIDRRLACSLPHLEALAMFSGLMCLKTRRLWVQPYCVQARELPHAVSTTACGLLNERNSSCRVFPNSVIGCRLLRLSKTKNLPLQPRCIKQVGLAPLACPYRALLAICVCKRGAQAHYVRRR